MSDVKSKFTVGDEVFVYTTQYSWVIGKITKVVKNTSYKPQSKKNQESIVADSLRKKENSHFLYTILVNDKLFNVSNVTLTDILEWDVDIYDDSIINEPVDDLLSLTHLHDGSILRTLAVRYMKEIIYTNIGVIVVALNPWNFKIPHYMDTEMKKYIAEADQLISENLLPHSWAQAHNTYYELCSNNENQSILVSGESGSGKTEAAKIVVKYISNISSIHGDEKQKVSADRISTNLMCCSPILEAFGNAKTVRNDNSSRFGKLMKLHFDPITKIMTGAHITKYLLEKSRIITCGPGERLYHAFYLCIRSPKSADVNLFTDKHESYKSLYAGKCLDNKEFSTKEDYQEVCDAMRHVSISDSLIEEVWKVASGVVHCCNVSFVKDGEGSKLDDKSEVHMKKACALWGVDYATILKECIMTDVVSGGELTHKLLSVHKATDVKDALCKALYSNVFSWLVEKCNAECDDGGDSYWIALLDIFGFEDFKAGNNFEQLCINYVNETLQHHYNWCIFTKDMELCKEEGIDTVDIKFPDLTPTINMIDRLFLYLDDECSLGTTDSSFLTTINLSFGKKEAAFNQMPTSRDSFGIHHFAGSVTYTVVNWLEKNRDFLKEAFKKLFKDEKTTNALSRELFLCQAREEALALEAIVKAGRKPLKTITLGAFLKEQMNDLMTVINNTNPHWIRCVKPHPEKKPLLLDGRYTLGQLEFAGILGTVKVRKAGYPVRFSYIKFCTQFNPIAPCHFGNMNASQLLEQVNKIIDTIKMNDKKYCQIGKTIVFIKNDAFHLFDNERKLAMNKYISIYQRLGRGYFVRKEAFLLKNIITIQRIGRGDHAKKSMFALYVIAHRDRILAERKKAEEERIKKEKEEAERRAAIAELLAAQEKELGDFHCDYEAEYEEVIAEEQNEFLNIIEPEYKRLLEALFFDQRREQMRHAIGILNKDINTAMEQIHDEEERLYRAIIRDFHSDMVPIVFRAKFCILQEEENRAREQILRDHKTDDNKNAAIYAELKRKMSAHLLRGEYEKTLAKNRQKRKEALDICTKMTQVSPISLVSDQFYKTPRIDCKSIGSAGRGRSSSRYRDGYQSVPLSHSTSETKHISPMIENNSRINNTRSSYNDMTSPSIKEYIQNVVPKSVERTFSQSPNNNINSPYPIQNRNTTENLNGSNKGGYNDVQRALVTVNNNNNNNNNYISSQQGTHHRLSESVCSSAHRQLLAPSVVRPPPQQTSATREELASKYVNVGMRVYIPHLCCYGVVVASQVPAAGSSYYSVAVALIQPPSEISSEAMKREHRSRYPLLETQASDKRDNGGYNEHLRSNGDNNNNNNDNSDCQLYPHSLPEYLIDGDERVVLNLDVEQDYRLLRGEDSAHDDDEDIIRWIETTDLIVEAENDVKLKYSKEPDYVQNYYRRKETIIRLRHLGPTMALAWDSVIFGSNKPSTTTRTDSKPREIPKKRFVYPHELVDQGGPVYNHLPEKLPVAKRQGNGSTGSEITSNNISSSVSVSEANGTSPVYSNWDQQRLAKELYY